MSRKLFFVALLSLLFVLSLGPVMVSAQKAQPPTPDATSLKPTPTPEPGDASTPHRPDRNAGPLQATVGESIAHDTSAPLSSLEPLIPNGELEVREIPMRPLPMPSNAPEAARDYRDPAIQDWHGNADKAIPFAPMPSPGRSFFGISNYDNQAQLGYAPLPPDTEGDVGPNHYIQWVNSVFAIYDKSGNRLYGPAAGNTLWQGFGGPCETSNDGDPIVLYDSIADRWFMSQLALPNYPNGPFYQCIAISKTPDPLGAWHRYAFKVHDAKMNDYPKFGVWPDGYYMTDNQFIGDGWGGAGVYVFDRANMLVGNPASFQYFDLETASLNFGGVLPSDLDGYALPPSGAPNYFAEMNDANNILHVWEFHTDWNNPANSTFGINGQPNITLTVTAFDSVIACGANGRRCIPQPGAGATQYLDALTDRLMYRLQYRNFGSYETLVVNHTVDVATNQAGIRWYELRKVGAGSWSVNQQSTYSPDATHRWMGSIAMDGAGDMALGFSASSGTVNPSVRYVGRLVTDTLSTMPQTEIDLATGGGIQQSTSNRWGDYSTISVDPSDDCTFWYTQEYYTTTSQAAWATRIGAFKFPSCSSSMGTLAGVVLNASNSNPIAGAQVQASRGATLTYSSLSGAGGSYAIILSPGTYTVTASAYGYQPSMITNITVAAGMTTTQNISLTPSTTSYLVSGAIKDAATGWPLYASINVSSLSPAYAATLWNDPVTGNYSVTLTSGITYTLSVNAWVSGYKPASRSFNLTGSRVENFNLNVDAYACSAPGYQKTTATLANSSTSFDGATFPPTGWAQVDVNGATGNWARVTAGTNPTNAPHSGAGEAEFNSYNATNAHSTRLYRTAGENLSAAASAQVSFWLYHYYGTTWDPANDLVQVQVSTDGGATWKYVGVPIYRYDSNLPANTGAWQQHTIDLSAYVGAGMTDVRIGLLGISGFGYNTYVDDVTMSTVSCLPQAGGLVVGNVYDANTSAAIAGATVSNDSGRSTITAATDDPHVADSFYTLFSPAGSHVFTATKTPYASSVQTPTVVASSTIRQDFNLSAGSLSYTPASLEARLATNSNMTVPFTITNGGMNPITFTLYEVPGNWWGGPDAFGYAWYTSTFAYINATGGTALNLPDDGAANITLPFAFPFYDKLVTIMRVSNNGAALMNNTVDGVTYLNTPISLAPDYFIAPWWDDMGTTAGNVYWTTTGAAPNRRVVVQWVRPHYAVGGTNTADYEIVLYENGNILFQYNDVVFGSATYNSGASATVGIRGPDAINSLQYSFAGASLAANRAICFWRPGADLCNAGDMQNVAWLSEAPTSANNFTGNQTVSVTFDSTGYAAGQYSALLRLAHTAPNIVKDVPVLMTAYATAPRIFTWTGQIDEKWNVAGNWTPIGGPPTASDDAVLDPAAKIGAAWPIVNADSSVYNLTIHAGAQLTISSPLKAQGTVTNDGWIIQTKQVNNLDAVSYANIKNDAGSDKYTGVTLTPDFTNMGMVTTTVRGNQNCGAAGNLGTTIKRCYEITPQYAAPATVRFYYRTAEENGNSTTPDIYHYIGSATWEKINRTASGSSGSDKWVEGGATAYSPFALKSGVNAPTAITLSSIEARAGANPPSSVLSSALLIAITFGTCFLLTKRRRG